MRNNLLDAVVKPTITSGRRGTKKGPQSMDQFKVRGCKCLTGLTPQGGFEPPTLRLTVASAHSARERYGVSLSNKHGPQLAISSDGRFIRGDTEFEVEGAQQRAQTSCSQRMP